MARRLTLEEFTALNQELSALTRLGVSLELGLAGLSRDLPGKLGRVAGAIAERLGKGETLERILECPSFGLPPAYRAVIAAGSRSGQLTRALEETAATARRVASVRRSLVLILTYPVIVVSIAYASLLVSLVWMTPKVLDALAGPLAELPARWSWLRFLADSVVWWAPWPPLIGMAALLWWQRGSSWRRWSWQGGSGTRVDPSRMATFLDLLGLMIGNLVPLPEALVLAADAAGVGRWQTGARTAAERLEAGERLSRTLLVESGLPAGLGWLVAGSSSPDRWAHWLRSAADGYRRQADRRQARLEQRWPIILSVGMGGGLALPLLIIMVLPWIELIQNMLS